MRTPTKPISSTPQIHTEVAAVETRTMLSGRGRAPLTPTEEQTDRLGLTLLRAGVTRNEEEPSLPQTRSPGE